MLILHVAYADWRWEKSRREDGPVHLHWKENLRKRSKEVHLLHSLSWTCKMMQVFTENRE
jgi:hypothetical protein